MMGKNKKITHKLNLLGNTLETPKKGAKGVVFFIRIIKEKIYGVNQ